MENLTESQIKRKIDTLKRALEDKNVPEVAHPKMKEDLKKFEKMLKDFEKEVEEEAEKDIKKVDDIADLDLPDLDLGEDKPKKPAKKRGRPKKKTYEITVDGKKFSFSDKAGKDNCQKAIALVKAQKDQQKESTKKYEAKSTSAKISNNLQTIAKQAVAKAKSRNVAPATLKKQVDAVEKAFKTLFNALETLMGAKISQAQRNAIMRILNDFEDKKTKTTRITKKEMGGKVDNWEDVDPDVLYAEGGEIIKQWNYLGLYYFQTKNGTYNVEFTDDTMTMRRDNGETVVVLRRDRNKGGMSDEEKLNNFLKNFSNTYAEGGEIIDTFTSIQGSRVMPNNPFTIEKENDFYVIKNSKGEVLAKDTTKEGIMNDKGMFLNLYEGGGEVQEPKNSWDWQSFL